MWQQAKFTAGSVSEFRLRSHEIHVWKLGPEPDANRTRYFSLLSREEQDKAQRFRFEHLTHSYVLDHGRLRQILAAYTHVAAEDLVFAASEYGKPRLATPADGLRFNLAHTNGLALIALCLDSEIGVDVEAVRPMEDWRDIAQSHFSPREHDALLRTPESDQQNAFFRCWTRKEAFLKANGFGLSKPLDAFSVSIAEEDFPVLLDCAWDAGEPGRWSLMSLPLEVPFAGALAVERGDWTISGFEWPVGGLLSATC
jgi:4'-phosphopantetheinyl transferase